MNQLSLCVYLRTFVSGDNAFNVHGICVQESFTLEGDKSPSSHRMHASEPYSCSRHLCLTYRYLQTRPFKYFTAFNARRISRPVNLRDLRHWHFPPALSQRSHLVITSRPSPFSVSQSSQHRSFLSSGSTGCPKEEAIDFSLFMSRKVFCSTALRGHKTYPALAGMSGSHPR